MFDQPVLDVLVFVGGVVVQDHMNRKAFGDFLVDGAQELQEISYRIGVYTGAPGEAEEDRQYFADQVKTAVAYIDAAIYELELGLDPKSSINAPQRRAHAGKTAIFLVHGHDEEAKHHVARIVQQLTGSEPIVLDEQASSGLTVIEKFELHSDRAAFAIVLLTPDDEGGPVGGPLRPRARQNVVLELGYFFARLGRGSVVALTKGDVDLPSDVSGMVYISLDKADWPQRLGKEMRIVDGLNIDMNQL
jgi:predicted nucleotide-binding protein